MFNTTILSFPDSHSMLTITPHSHIGITNIGVLVWTVAPDSEASLYKTLIANTEVRFTRVVTLCISVVILTHHIY